MKTHGIINIKGFFFDNTNKKIPIFNRFHIIIKNLMVICSVHVAFLSDFVFHVVKFNLLTMEK